MPLPAGGSGGSPPGGNRPSPSTRASPPQPPDAAYRDLTQNFASEHRIFVRAILQLLAERDRFALEADANDPHPLKAGPLKKATGLVGGVGMWRVKYVEVRRGLLSYYEDTTEGAGPPTPASLVRRRTGGTTEVGGVAAAGSGSAAWGAGGEGGGGGGGGGGPRSGTHSAALGAAGGGGSGPDPALRRKSIPLRADTCTCRAVKVQSKALSHTPLQPSGAVLELSVRGGPRRLWMCNTREERQVWIRAIHEAMIGGSVTRGDNFSEYEVERKRGGIFPSSSRAAVSARSPHREDLDRYMRLQEELRNADSKASYVGALAELYSGTKSLRVPVQWMRERIEGASSGSGPGGAFHEDGVSSGVVQLWKDMLRDSISINGDMHRGSSGHGPERIIGTLARSILRFDKSSTQNMNATKEYRKKFCITEAQAVSYARDVLLACNRTRSGGDSYYCMDALCCNQGLVVVCPSSMDAYPLRIAVQHAANNDPARRASSFEGFRDISGWILTRSGPNKSWKKRFGVLSMGILSYYEQAHPKPNGLRGQLLLAGVTVAVSQVGASAGKSNGMEEQANSKSANEDEGAPILAKTGKHVVSIISKDKSKERQIIFDDQMEFYLWNNALREAIKTNEVLAKGDRNNGATKASSGIVSFQGASTVANKIRGLSALVGSPGRHGKGSIGHEGDEMTNDNISEGDNQPLVPVGSHLKVKGGRAQSTLEISVQSSAVYKICSVDPQGDDSEDTWAMVRTKFFQNFRLSGGPNGRIMRGEEIVELNFLPGLVADEAFDQVFSHTSSKSIYINDTEQALKVSAVEDEDFRDRSERRGV
jgi:hypothetical protein